MLQFMESQRVRHDLATEQKAITERVYLCNRAYFCPNASLLHPDIKFILIDLHLQFLKASLKKLLTKPRK